MGFVLVSDLNIQARPETVEHLESPVRSLCLTWCAYYSVVHPGSVQHAAKSMVAFGRPVRFWKVFGMLVFSSFSVFDRQPHLIAKPFIIRGWGDSG